MTFQALIIDDDSECQATIRAVVESIDGEVTAALSNLDGSNQYATLRFDVVLLSTDMTGPVSIEVAKKFRQAGDKVGIPIVGLMGAPTEELKRQWWHVGVNTLLTKPIVPRRLLEILRGFDLGVVATAGREEALAVFEALSNEKRLDLFERIIEHGRLSATEAAGVIGISRPLADHHIKVLKRAHVVLAHVQGKEHPLEAWRKPLTAAAQWMLDLAARPVGTPPPSPPTDPIEDNDAAQTGSGLSFAIGSGELVVTSPPSATVLVAPSMT